MLFLAINVIGLAIYARVTRGAARFAVVTGRAYRPRQTALRGWRWPALALLMLHLVLTIALPVLVLLWTSITPRILQPSGAALRGSPLRRPLSRWTPRSSRRRSGRRRSAP